jgi:hypothetical protein
MKILIDFETDDEEDAAIELARIAKLIRNGFTSGPCYGDELEVIGQWDVTK